MRRGWWIAAAVSLLVACSELRAADPPAEAGAPADDLDASAPVPPPEAGADAEAGGPSCDLGNEFPLQWTKLVKPPSSLTLDADAGTATFVAGGDNPASQLSIGFGGNRVGSITCTFHVKTNALGRFDLIDFAGQGQTYVHLVGGIDGDKLAVRDDHVRGIGCDAGICTIARGVGGAVDLETGIDLTFTVADNRLELGSGDASATTTLLGGPRTLALPELRLGLVGTAKAAISAEISKVCCHTTL